MLTMYSHVAGSEDSMPEHNESKVNKFIAKIQNDKIAEYEHWDIYIDIKQYYLGRVFVWAKRSDARDLTSLTPEELLEWHKILKELKAVYAKTFKPDDLNFAFLGNEMPHCHCHVVPRYKTPREFMSVQFKDENWGHNYSRPNVKDFKIKTDVHEAIKNQLKSMMLQEKNDNEKLSSVKSRVTTGSSM